MEQIIFKRWWLIALKGGFLILFGFMALLFAGEAMALIATILGVLVLLSGLGLIFGALTHKGVYRYWLFWIIEGIIDVVFACLLIFYPYQVIQIFFAFIGWWAIIIGVFQFVYAFSILWNRPFTILTGTLSILLGIIILMNPFAGALIATYFVAIHTIAMGALVVFYALELKKMKQKDMEHYFL